MSEYTLVRSRRRSLALRILPDGTLEVRAPLRVSREEVERMIAAHARWIAAQRARVLARAQKYPEPTPEEEQVYITKARAILPPLVARYGAQMGLHPARLTVTGARTRFGSCSAKGNLAFSWRLMRYPEAAVEAVVVHELAHLRYMNHQKEFYALVLSVLPDYRERARLLKE